MFEKLKSAVQKNIQPNESRDLIVGLIGLIVLLSLMYFVGVSDGRSAAVAEKIDQLQKTIDKDRACPATKSMEQQS